MERIQEYATTLVQLAGLLLLLTSAVACTPTVDRQALANEKRKLVEEGARIEEELRRVKAEQQRRAEEDWRARWCPEKVQGLTELIDHYEEKRAEYLWQRANLKEPTPGASMETFKSYVRKERVVDALGEALSTLPDDMSQAIDSYWRTSELERCKGTTAMQMYFRSDQYKFAAPALDKWNEKQRKLTEARRRAEAQRQAEEETS